MRTPLLTAFEQQNFKAAKNLIKEGTDLNSSYINYDHSKNNLRDINEFEKFTPLMFACHYNKPEFVELLLEKNARIDQENYSGNNAIHVAIYANSIECLKLLLKYGVDPNSKGRHSRAAIHIALLNGNLEIMKLLISYGADLDYEDIIGTYFLYCVRYNFLDGAKLLLEHGADLSKVSNRDKYSALMCSCMEEEDGEIKPLPNSKVSSLEMAKFILSLGVDINYDIYGKTALMIAIRNNNYNLVDYLLRHGAKPDRAGDDQDAVYYAIKYSTKEVLELLLKYGATLDNRYGYKGYPKIYKEYTVLIVATFYNKVEIVKLLLEKGIDPNTLDYQGNSALSYASVYKQKEIAELLLQNGAETNIYNKNHETPLLLCCDNLLDQKYDFYDEDFAIITENSEDCSFSEMVSVLLKHGADITAKDNNNVSILIKAVKTQEVNLVKELLLQDVNINGRDIHGLTPLMWAVIYDNCDILKLLLEYKADMTLKNQDGLTAMILAYLHSDKEIIEQLEEILYKGQDLASFESELSNISSSGAISLKWVAEYCMGGPAISEVYLGETKLPVTVIQGCNTPYAYLKNSAIQFDSYEGRGKYQPIVRKVIFNLKSKILVKYKLEDQTKIEKCEYVEIL